MRKPIKSNASYLENVKIHAQGTAQQKFNRDIYNILSNPNMKATTAYKNYMKAVEALAASFAKEIVTDNPSISIYDETINTIGKILNPRKLKNSEDGGFASDIEWFKTSYLNTKNIKKYTGVNLDVEADMYTRLIGPDKKSLSSLQKATAVRKYISKALKENPKDPEATTALNTIATSGVLSSYIAQYNLLVQKYNTMHENAQKALNKYYNKEHNIMMNYIDPNIVKTMEQFYDIAKKTPSLLVNAGVDKESISIQEREFILSPGKSTNDSLLKFFKDNNIDFNSEVYRDLTYVKNLYYSMEQAKWHSGLVDVVYTLIDNGYASIVANIFKNNKDLEVVFHYDPTESIEVGVNMDRSERAFTKLLKDEIEKLYSKDHEFAAELASKLPSVVDVIKNIKAQNRVRKY